ncbi:hypothetical protein CORMATOL_00096 [Corynebacterium matruchotii ATCC 33806]|uniref:Uncharacterized protein n=1 Tax=Corynebacterium matruchotii ATCC 33806 TaxID=566549 RepID=C0DZF7_9CORY|nr:hypothetical protein CORMATOL_00096 [Corynebacterium matruchotii ATCC 33806]
MTSIIVSPPEDGLHIRQTGVVDKHILPNTTPYSILNNTPSAAWEPPIALLKT